MKMNFLESLFVPKTSPKKYKMEAVIVTDFISGFNHYCVKNIDVEMLADDHNTITEHIDKLSIELANRVLKDVKIGYMLAVRLLPIECK